MRTVSHYVTMYWLFDRFHGAGLGAEALPQALGLLNNMVVVLSGIFSNTLSNSLLRKVSPFKSNQCIEFRSIHFNLEQLISVKFSSLLFHLPSA